MVQRMLTTASHRRGFGWLLLSLLFGLTTILPIINASTTTITAVSTTTQATRKILKKEKGISITGTRPTFLPPPSTRITKEERQEEEEEEEQQEEEEDITTSTTNNSNKKEKMVGTDNNMKKLDFLDDLRTKYSHQPTFLQSVEEIALSLLPLFEDPKHGEFYKRAFVAMTEPERVISFRVPWMDDNGNIQFNRGWRVEFSR